jgi:membrane-anchored glycerophosphoryl diester phosphodiesterase, putative
MRWFVLAIAGLSFSLEGYVYLNFPLENVPITISHRGVSRENGIQNTVEALEKTALLKPDLVEMDVQETKDGQFVMMHDANLKQLAGLDAQTQDLTLAELTSLEISENGYRAKISSFDDYFTRANQLGQRLLIEIKTSKKDSKDMMERFLSKYGAKIKVYQHQIQSLDYQVIDQVVNYDSSIPSFFILPYNTIFPRTKASGYTMEYSTLDENFVNKLWQSDKRLYDWTINDEDSIVKSFRLGVDGMITDDLELVQSSIKELKDDPDYTTLLLNKSIDLLSFS